MKIFLISDIHYGSNSNYAKHNSDENKLSNEYVNSFGSRFESFVPEINSLVLDYDLIINLGDLINEESIGQDMIRYKKAMEFFGKSKPVKHVAGNHDLNCLSREQLASIIGISKLYYSFDFDSYHHIVLDGTRDSRPEPHRIDAEQLEWLKNDLLRTNLQTLVYCHYPLDEQSVSHNYYFKDKPERAFISNRAEVRNLLEKSSKVLAVFNGHLHFEHQEYINGIKYITVPSFSENNGNHVPKAEYMRLVLENNQINSEIVKINKSINI